MAYDKVSSRPEVASGGYFLFARELWKRSSRTIRGQHPDDERDVLGGRGDDHEHMEDLVKAEPPRPRIWPPARVDDCARGIEHAAAGEQGQRRRTEPVEQFGQCENGYPPEREVAARNHSTRGIDPAERERDPGRSSRPRDPENHPSERPVENEQRNRGVTRGDEDEDRAVVEPLKHRLDASRRRPSVIQPATTEQRGEGDTIDRHGDRRTPSRGKHDRP